MKIYRKANQNIALFVFGTLYPAITGGMQIFNYYFLKAFINNPGRKIFYWSTNPLDGNSSNHLKITSVRPVSLTYPLQLLWVLMKYDSVIRFVYTGYARQSWIIPYFSALLFRVFRKPYIVTIHSGGLPIWKPAYPYKYYFRHAHTLVGVSKSICADYSRLLDNKEVLYIPPLIPFRKSEKNGERLRNELGLSATDKILLFAGTLKKMKNPDKVLDGFSIFRKECPDAIRTKLIFAGDGEMMNTLKAAVEEKKLTGQVIFTGLVSRDRMPDLYALASYYIIASDYEGTSVSLLEAMYNQLPIIAADAPGINKMLESGKTALLYPPQDVEALAHRLIQLCSDHVMADQLAENANRYFNEHYSYESMLNKYEALFTNASMA